MWVANHFSCLSLKQSNFYDDIFPESLKRDCDVVSSDKPLNTLALGFLKLNFISIRYFKQQTLLTYPSSLVCVFLFLPGQAVEGVRSVKCFLSLSVGAKLHLTFASFYFPLPVDFFWHLSNNFGSRGERGLGGGGVMFFRLKGGWNVWWIDQWGFFSHETCCLSLQRSSNWTAMDGYIIIITPALFGQSTKI